MVSPRALDRNRRNDYVSAWTVSLQRSLLLNFIATLNYMGNKGTEVLTTTGHPALERRALPRLWRRLGNSTSKLCN